MKKILMGLLLLSVMILVGCSRKPGWEKWLDKYETQYYEIIEEMQNNLDEGLPIHDLQKELNELNQKHNQRLQEVYEESEEEYQKFLQEYIERFNN